MSCKINSELDHLINPISRDTRIENLRKELIKEKSFYDAYALTELNSEIPVADLEIEFMKDVVKEHGTNKQVLKEAVESVGVRESMHPVEISKLLNDTLKTEEYNKAFEQEHFIKNQENLK